MPKKSIRDTMLGRRKQLSAEICLNRSLKAQQRLLELPQFAAASTVGLYSPVWNEVFTEEIFRAARAPVRTAKTAKMIKKRPGFSISLLLLNVG